MLKLRIPPQLPSHLSPSPASGATQSARAGSQRGVSLIVALVVLIALTLSGVALIRSMDTTNLIAAIFRLSRPPHKAQIRAWKLPLHGWLPTIQEVS